MLSLELQKFSMAATCPICLNNRLIRLVCAVKNIALGITTKPAEWKTLVQGTVVERSKEPEIPERICNQEVGTKWRLDEDPELS